MRRWHIALLSLLAATALASLTATASAQAATTTPRQHPAAASHVAAPAELARPQAIGRGGAAVAPGSGMRPASYWYKQGYLVVCNSWDNCNAWSDEISAGVTMDGSQIWDNWYRCYGSGVTWCGGYGNGTGALTLGDNFGRGGWLRVTFYANGAWSSSHPGWEWPYMYCYAGGSSACSAAAKKHPT